MTTELTIAHTAFLSPTSRAIMARLKSEQLQKQAQQRIDARMADLYQQREQARKTGGFSFLR